MTEHSLAAHPDFDPTSAHGELAELRSLAARGDWRSVEGFFAQVDDPSDRVFTHDVLSSVRGSEKLWAAQAQNAPRAPLPALLLAARHVAMARDAWQDSTFAGREAARHARYLDHLRQAERLLVDVVAREPDHVDAWHWRIVTARRLDLGLSETRRRYERLRSLAADHFPGQSQYLEQLCPRWGGDWDAVHAFAAVCLREATPGTNSPALVVQAHLERWMELGGGDEGDLYLCHPRVINEVTKAAEHSVLHPDYRWRYGWVSVHGMFAMFFSLVHRPTWAAVHFRQLGNRAGEVPWGYFADKEKAFKQRRAEAMAAVGES